MNPRERNVKEGEAVKPRVDVIRKRRRKKPLSYRYFATNDFLAQEKLAGKNKNDFSLHRMRRISPFLLLGFFLVGLFPYMFITGAGVIHSALLLLFLFIFLEVNVLFADFALWNYFEGKKVLKIWLIEVPITILIIHFLL